MEEVGSEGEILDQTDEFETISSGSEDDFFSKLKDEIAETKSRKAELELENTFANFEPRKENFVNHNNIDNPWRSSKKGGNSPRKRMRMSSISRGRERKKSSTNTFIRATSVFSKRPLISKRKKTISRNSNRKRSRLNSYSSTSDRRDKTRDHITIDDDDQSENDDEELLELRLMALKTKPEVRAMENKNQQEEEKLRIEALRSVILEKSEEIRQKKLRKKLIDNNRPYSPTDQPEVDMDICPYIMSPLGSPFIEENNGEIDMDICDSPDEKELSDMDVVESSPPTLDSPEDDDTIADDEITLRAQLLVSLTRKKQEEKEEAIKKQEETKEITENLKLAVQRIRQKKQIPTPVTNDSKKFLAVIEKLRNKQVQSHTQEQKKLEELMMMENNQLQSTSIITANLPEPPSTITIDLTDDIVPQEKNVLDQTFLSTITDTKNIPMINTTKTNEIKSRLVTSLEQVIKPVPKLIITVNMDSDSENDDMRSKKNVRKVTKVTRRKNDDRAFEMQLDSFLKNVRKEQEDKEDCIKTKDTTTKSSAVKHLPLSSQMEYEKLVEKMKFLEEEKQKRLRVRQLKRTKSITSNNELKDETSSNKLLEKTQPKQVVQQKLETVIINKKPEMQSKGNETMSEKINNTLKKINLLDQEAQARLMIKTEINYQKHSENLLQAAKESVQIIANHENDLQKHEEINNEIIELERQLKRQKSNLNIMNKKLRSNVNKFVQSQRELIDARNRQKNFEKNVCIPFGKTMKGPDYQKPNFTDLSHDLHDHYKHILEKVENFIKLPHISSDQTFKNNMKVIEERLKRFIQADALVVEHVKLNQTPIQSEIEQQPTQNEQEVAIIYPEQVTNSTLMNEECEEEADYLNVKFTYNSPLDFLRSNKNKVESVNQILCPYKLNDGMCADEKCQMMHI